MSPGDPPISSPVLGLQELTTTWDLSHLDARGQIQVFTSSRKASTLLTEPSPQLVSSVLITNPVAFPLGPERSRAHGWFNCVFYQTVGPSCRVAFSNSYHLNADGTVRREEMRSVSTNLPAVKHALWAQNANDPVTRGCHSNFITEKLILGLRSSSEENTCLACLGSRS